MSHAHGQSTASAVQQKPDGYPSTPTQIEAAAQALFDRECERCIARGRTPHHPVGTLVSSMPPSYRDDYEADARAMLDAASGKTRIVEPYMALIGNNHAVCVGGKWDGWKFWQHPDGQWVSIEKLHRLSLSAELRP